MRRSRSLLCSALCALALAAAASPAQADPAVADTLFKQAKELLAEGRITEACEKFEASYVTDPALGAVLNLADCLERDGRFASAYGRWGEAVELALRKNDDRIEFARERRDALKPKLSFLTVMVKGTADGLDVYRGDTKLAAGAYGVELPSDPGETAVQVVRNDSVLWERKIVLKETDRATIEVDLAEIARINPPPVKRRTGTGQGGGGSRPGGETPIPFWNAQRVAGLSVLGLGLAGGAVGFALGGVALGKSGEIDSQCTEGETRFCTVAGQEAAVSAGTFADASTWTLIAGGILTGVGLTVMLTAPTGGEAVLEERAGIDPGPSVGLIPVAGPEGAGLFVFGVF